MLLSSKHENVTSVVRADFSGGLNTSIDAAGVAENQLADAVNVEVEHSTGRLRTSPGTKEMFGTDEEIFAALYDGINKVLLLVFADRTVHVFDGESLGDSLGVLAGNLYPSGAAWEDGILIASGGKLQYFDGNNLKTIDSPQANSVFVRASRVLVTDDTSVHYGGVGDEENWTDESNDDSSAKFVEAGYKDGGSFIGMANLYGDIMLIKDNRRVYRLTGEYPDWQITEISRNIACSGRLAFCAARDSVFILGGGEFCLLRTTDYYGDVLPENAGIAVKSELLKLPQGTMLRFLPSPAQIWLIAGDKDVLVFDIVFGAWFRRRFNANVIDAIDTGDKVLVLKKHAVCELDDLAFADEGLPLKWSFTAKRLVSKNEYLVKRSQISVVPFSPVLYTGRIDIGAIRIPLPVPDNRFKVWGNKSRCFKNRIKVMYAGRYRGTYAKGEPVYDNEEICFGNGKKVFARGAIIKECRDVYRGKFVDIKGSGTGGGFYLGGIFADIAEV